MGTTSSFTTIKCESRAIPLLTACRTGNLTILNHLLTNEKVNLNVVYINQGTSGTNYYYSPLLIACNDNHLEAVKLLLANNANVNVQIGDRTPLYNACSNDNYELVKILLEAGAIIGSSDKIVKFETYNSDNDCLMAACNFRSDIKITELLLEKGAKVQQKHLLMACMKNNIDFLKLYMEKGAIPCEECLAKACAAKNTEMVMLLLKSGVIVTNSVMNTVAELPQDKVGGELTTLILGFRKMQQHPEMGRKVIGTKAVMGEPVD